MDPQPRRDCAEPLDLRARDVSDLCGSNARRVHFVSTSFVRSTRTIPLRRNSVRRIQWNELTHGETLSGGQVVREKRCVRAGPHRLDSIEGRCRPETPRATTNRRISEVLRRSCSSATLVRRVNLSVADLRSVSTASTESAQRTRVVRMKVGTRGCDLRVHLRVTGVGMPSLL